MYFSSILWIKQSARVLSFGMIWKEFPFPFKFQQISDKQIHRAFYPDLNQNSDSADTEAFWTWNKIRGSRDIWKILLEAGGGQLFQNTKFIWKI